MLFYISSKEARYKLRKVIVDNYQEQLIVGGLRNRTRKVAFELSERFGTWDVYKCLPTVEFHLESILPCFEVLPNEPIKLKDYLIEYGYDYKSKTIDGLTLNKHVKQYMRMK
tara:strand:- start:3373 stop:3708 length:336 start_codon:yes stop_codon:yes gene_type:complete